MLRVRAARKEDFEIIADFQLMMARETEGLELEVDELTRGVLAVFKNQQKGSYFVAENDKEIVASLLTTYEWSDWRNKNIIWLQSVYVIPEYRGKKIFSMMYKYVKGLAEKDQNIAGIRLYVDNTNRHAHMVYNAIGMNGSHYTTFEWMK